MSRMRHISLHCPVVGGWIHCSNSSYPCFHHVAILRLVIPLTQPEPSEAKKLGLQLHWVWLLHRDLVNETIKCLDIDRCYWVMAPAALRWSVATTAPIVAKL